MSFLRAATVLAILAVSAAPALADDNGFSGFGPDAPPGVTTPDRQVDLDDRERDPIGPYGDLSDELADQPFNTRSQPFTPINELAGETYKADPGIIGGALGRVKNNIFGAN